MQESNVSGLLGMSFGGDDGEVSNSGYGNLSDRFSRRDEHYLSITRPKSNGMSEADRIRSTLKNVHPYDRGKAKYRALSARLKQIEGGSLITMPNLKMPDLGKIVPLAMYLAIGFAGYKLYKKFFGNDVSDYVDDAKETAAKTVANSYVNNTANAVKDAGTTAASLSVKGIVAGDMHRAYASNLHSWMNSAWVDHDKIVGLIKSMGDTTFKLVNIEYKTRELDVYAGSFAHIFNGELWNFSGSGTSSNKLLGTLKYHLKTVLTSDELSSIQKYLNLIT